MNMDEIILIGYGGHGKSVADCIEREHKYKIVGYIDVHEVESPYPYLGNDDKLQELYEQGIENAAVCIGYLGKGEIRQNLYRKLKAIGFKLPVIKDPSAIIADSAEIGEGTFIGKGAIVNSEAVIGKMAIINTKALIEHECKVADFSHVAVAAVLCGNVSIGQASFVGANATIIQGRSIEPKFIVPAGAVIR